MKKILDDIKLIYSISNKYLFWICAYILYFVALIVISGVLKGVGLIVPEVLWVLILYSTFVIHIIIEVFKISVTIAGKIMFLIFASGMIINIFLKDIFGVVISPYISNGIQIGAILCVVYIHYQKRLNTSRKLKQEIDDTLYSNKGGKIE